MDIVNRLMKYKMAYNQLKKRQLQGDLGPIRTEDLSDEAAGAVLVTKVEGSPARCAVGCSGVERDVQPVMGFGRL